MCAQICNVIEAYKLDAGHDGREGFAILGLVRGGHGAEGAAVEAVLKREELCPDGLAFTAQQACVCASELECALPCLSAGVAEENAIEAGEARQALCKLGLSLMKEEVRCMDERAALARDGIDDGRMAVAERVDADAAEQVEITLALFVDEVNALAADEENRVPFVG